MNQAWHDQLGQFGRAVFDSSMKKLTTIRVGGTVAALVYPYSLMSLVALIDFLKQEGLDYRVIGHGSNILASDEAYPGVIIKLTQTLNHAFFGQDQVLVEAGASLMNLSAKASDLGYSNLEWAAGIPGSLGGAVWMDAGAYKMSMSDIVDRVLVLKNQQLQWVQAVDCDFGYRTSRFQKDGSIILAAVLKLQKKDPLEIKEVMKRRHQARMNSQPLNSYSFGSTFRNPDHIGAWQLIDGAGARGLQVGRAMVNTKHANFLVNLDEATAQDVYNLIKKVQDLVYAKYQVQLKLEVEKFNWKSTQVK